MARLSLPLQHLKRPFRRPPLRLVAVWAAAALPLALLGADTPVPFAGTSVAGTPGPVRIDLGEIGQVRRLAEATPMEFLEIPRDRARRLNAMVPYSTAPNPAARPFRIGGDPASQARAAACLAAAQYYEAGGDFEGQRAVAQVVLNRVRHPAYPGTVCGVVFQGAERRTGCQFTFTCDGAMAREPMPWLWQRALGIAQEALAGSVYAKVGLATHYHTDWVVPVWSGSLDKITKVDTHLFFRWTGGWGRPPAFHNALSQTEPVIARLARIDPSHAALPVPEETTQLALDEGVSIIGGMAAGAESGQPLPALPGVNLRGSQLRLAHPSGDAFGFLLANELPGSFGLLAYDVCRGRAFCKVMGWTNAADIPRGYPIPFAAQQSVAFLYIYDRASRAEIMAWNCEQFPRSDPAECLTSEMTRWDAVQQLGN